MTQLAISNALPVVKRVIAALAKSVDYMIRTKVTQLVKASVLPAVRRVIAALAKSVNCMNRTKATPIQPGKKHLYGRTVMLGGN